MVRSRASTATATATKGRQSSSDNRAHRNRYSIVALLGRFFLGFNGFFIRALAVRSSLFGFGGLLGGGGYAAYTMLLNVENPIVTVSTPTQSR